ncbi:alpha/beta hydrolase [Chryseobacterium sp. C-71]|uniref:alpha/beta fold hydrolase n=1 Tax=Chryseobacterium sp. C-71 TaxID=2893882 RepID=UPI001E2EAB9C|nr:alpha/beta hydrolase [Chryseobacterium sp. C-71]UFH33101.1 alpha/beta hydrolase [Chryseobacterium sp. C-71]
MKHTTILFFALLLFGCNKTSKESTEINNHSITDADMKTTKFRKLMVNGINIAYREAGNSEKPTLVLLHGYPASSHQYRKVLDQLSDDYHLIAPDYPGFGDSDLSAPDQYEYTFDNIANTIDDFLEKKGLSSYAIVMQDYGAPIGFRIATKHPERVTAIITQNGNAYEEGLGEGWKLIRELWKDRNEKTESVLLPAFTLEGLKNEYTHGTRNKENINPDSWQLDYLRMSRPNAHKVNLDLWYDYQNNVKLYPKWQKYLRDYQPPLLVVWGKNDVYFPESGAAAYKKDVKNIDYNIYDTGHFAMEEEGEAIIEKIRSFMNKLDK